MTNIHPKPSSDEYSVVSKPNLSWARNARTSCDLCKRMKVKCRRKDDEDCAGCVTRKIPCITTPVERKRRKLIKGNLEDMEERIRRMESAIVTSRVNETREPSAEREEEETSSNKIETQAELSDNLSNLVLEQKGSPNFIGWASGFSLLSPKGLQWISRKVADKDEFEQLVRKMSHDYGVWGRADGDDLWFPVPRSQHSPLPSKDLATQHIESYFATFNSAFPVVNQKVFKFHFEQQYSANPPTSTPWYALLNTILCLGSIATAAKQDRHTKPSYLVDYTCATKEPGVEYFRNASACFHELFFKEANLMAMQAMTLMLYLASSSSNPQPAYTLASAVGSLSNTLGLHRSASGFGVSPSEIEQRRNVFWTFYLLEKGISHNLGRPSVINDDDIAVELPPKKTGLIRSPSGARVYDLFRDNITLAIIGSRICIELYSASSQTKSEADRTRMLGKLDTYLQRWRDEIPLEIRPEHSINCSDEQYVQVVMMHFLYLDAVILLHRLSGHLCDDSNVTMLNHGSVNPRVYASQLLCLAAARRSINLLDTVSNSSHQLMWTALYYPLSASLVLFAAILSDPSASTASTDIQLMNLISSFIARRVKPGSSFDSTPTLSMFPALHAIAARLVEKSPSQHMHKSKRPLETDDLAADALTSNVLHPTHEETNSSPPQAPSNTSTSPESSLDFAPFLPLSPSTFDFAPFDWTATDDDAWMTWPDIEPSVDFTA